MGVLKHFIICNHIFGNKASSHRIKGREARYGIVSENAFFDILSQSHNLDYVVSPCLG